MKTKVYAVAEKVPEDCKHLTAGKLYQAVPWDGARFRTINDKGKSLICPWENSSLLDGGNWTRIEVPEWSDADIDRMAEAAADEWHGYNRWGTLLESEKDDWRAVVRAVLKEAGL